MWSGGLGSAAASSSAAVGAGASGSASHQSCSRSGPTADCAAHRGAVELARLRGHALKKKQWCHCIWWDITAELAHSCSQRGGGQSTSPPLHVLLLLQSFIYCIHERAMCVYVKCRDIEFSYTHTWREGGGNTGRSTTCWSVCFCNSTLSPAWWNLFFFKLVFWVVIHSAERDPLQLVIRIRCFIDPVGENQVSLYLLPQQRIANMERVIKLLIKPKINIGEYLYAMK